MRIKIHVTKFNFTKTQLAFTEYAFVVTQSKKLIMHFAIYRFAKRPNLDGLDKTIVATTPPRVPRECASDMYNVHTCIRNSCACNFALHTLRRPICLTFLTTLVFYTWRDAFRAMTPPLASTTFSSPCTKITVSTEFRR